MLCRPELAGDPRFVNNSARYANRPDLDAEIDAVLGAQPFEAVVKALAANGVAYGALNEVSDLSAHPQLRRIEVGSPSGPVRLPAPAVRWQEEANRGLGSSPALDADGAALRRSFA